METTLLNKRSTGSWLTVERLFIADGGPDKTRTCDLTLIRRAL